MNNFITTKGWKSVDWFTYASWSGKKRVIARNKPDITSGKHVEYLVLSERNLTRDEILNIR